LLLLNAIKAEPMHEDDVLPFRNPDLPVEKRVEDLISRLTIEEKISQTMMGGLGGDRSPRDSGV
jgi:beta-glucosidase